MFSMYLSFSSINKFSFNIGKSCYAQVFLEEFKYIVKGKKVKNYILGGLELSLDDLDVETSDQEKTEIKYYVRAFFKGAIYASAS